MKQVMNLLICVITSVIVSLLISSTRSRVRNEKQDLRVSRDPSPQFAGNLRNVPLLASPSSHTESRKSIAPPTDPRIREAAMKHRLESEFMVEARDQRWASDHENRINTELTLLEELSAPIIQHVECRATLCMISLEHRDEKSIQAVRQEILDGKVLNKPDILNEENRCNLHSFMRSGTRQESIFIECRGGI